MDELDEFSEEVHRRLYRAFEEAARHKRSTQDECLFEMNLFEELSLLHFDILHGTYHPSPGIAFIVTDPVKREVFAAPFRDRVVHHFLYDVVAPWWETRLIYDTYSCRPGKGTNFGVERLARQIRQASRNYTRRVYVAKFDIQGYFMSLPRQGLYDRVLWGLNRQFPNRSPMYDIQKNLWHEVIFDDPTKNVRRKGNISLWDDLPLSKSLFHQPRGCGIVIGNLSSQLLSNIYMDPFDRFVKNDLGYKYYGRYVDDFYIILTEEQLPYLKENVRTIELKLSEMRLKLHPKKRSLQEAYHGTPFLGWVVYPGWIVPAKRIRNNFYHALERLESGHGDVESIISYLGLMSHYNSKTAIGKIFYRLGQEYNY